MKWYHWGQVIIQFLMWATYRSFFCLIMPNVHDILIHSQLTQEENLGSDQSSWRDSLGFFLSRHKKLSRSLWKRLVHPSNPFLGSYFFLLWHFPPEPWNQIHYSSFLRVSQSQPVPSQPCSPRGQLTFSPGPFQAPCSRFLQVWKTPNSAPKTCRFDSQSG